MRKQRTVFWIALFSLPFLAMILTSSLSKRRGLVDQVQILERETERMNRENERLNQLVEGVQSDVLKELEVRKKLNYAKPGEVLVLFVSPSPVVTPSPEPSWWQRIFK
ncbi:MAG: hypothetical protein UX66_C0003G0016 [Parcubacteria group bacterium GW2011_GWF2_46_8]|nr:MAG: hypothetical protein UX66_C0003G0016 [Parcubacteria group bacterium GW2011_GWF2_46_8]